MRIPSPSRAPLAQRARLAACGLMFAAFLAGCSGGESSDPADGADQAGLDGASDARSDAAAGTDGRSGLPADTAAAAPSPPAAPPDAPMPPQPVPGTDAAILSEQASPAAADPRFDARAFAGTYSGGTTRLDIGAEGQFALDESGQALTGTWALQPGGKTIVLDPDAKGDTDRLLQLEPDGSVRIAGGATLRRQ